MSQEVDSFPSEKCDSKSGNTTTKNATSEVAVSDNGESTEKVKSGKTDLKEDMEIMTQRAPVTSAREMFQRKIDESSRKKINKTEVPRKKIKRPAPTRNNLKSNSPLLQKQNLKKKTILRRLRSELQRLQGELQNANHEENEGLHLSSIITELTEIIQTIEQVFSEANKSGKLVSQHTILQNQIVLKADEQNKQIIKSVIDDVGLFSPGEHKQNSFLAPPSSGGKRNNSSSSSNSRLTSTGGSKNNVKAMVERYRSLSGESRQMNAYRSNRSVSPHPMPRSPTTPILESERNFPQNNFQKPVAEHLIEVYRSYHL